MENSVFNLDDAIDPKKSKPEAKGAKGAKTQQDYGIDTGENEAKAGENEANFIELNYQSPEYPIDALGPLAEVCRSISENGQVDAAMVGQSLLGGGISFVPSIM